MGGTIGSTRRPKHSKQIDARRAANQISRKRWEPVTRTGRTEMVKDLAHLWAAAERLAGRPCDPLEESLVARLEAEHD